MMSNEIVHIKAERVVSNAARMKVSSSKRAPSAPEITAPMPPKKANALNKKKHSAEVLVLTTPSSVYPEGGCNHPTNAAPAMRAAPTRSEFEASTYICLSLNNLSM
ncbi:hypothetical protein KC19_1G279400 [Ceratodon purpureus]|uniref:Uncharacterized protein n=1 Tax=Ceratodon purpureus TaxID=3225 RepID=A0A8T0JBT2_CERPU|nr:hypothetical protein KC19_1G279400 [Ceratodon purpureus]